MKLRKVFLGMLLAMAIIVPSSLAWASATENFLSVKNLQVGEFRQISSDSDLYSANVTDSGIALAHINVIAYQAAQLNKRPSTNSDCPTGSNGN
jgi:hypothetical protein